MMKNKISMAMFAAVFALSSCCPLMSRVARADNVELPGEQHSGKINIVIDRAGLGQLVEKVREQTGYHIIFSNLAEDKIKSMTISGQFLEVTVDELVGRVFRANNTLIIHDNLKKTVEVRFFGDKLPQNSFIAENQHVDVSSAGQGLVEITSESDPDADPLTGLDLAYLNAKHREQEEELEIFRNDPTSIDPLTGLNVLELREKHRVQDIVRQEKLVDELVVDAQTNLTLGELRARHEKARQEREELKKSGVDPWTGISVAELNERHKRQAKEFEERTRAK